MDRIICQVNTGIGKGNTLILAMDKHKKIKNAKKLKITISSPDLNRIQFKGVGNIHIDNKFVTGRLDIESKGVGDVNVQELDCQNLTVNSMGVGNVNLKGKVVNANLSSKGVGDVEATDLEATHVKASSNGVGNISCNATQSLDAAVKGVGSINYKGNPAQKHSAKRVWEVSRVFKYIKHEINFNFFIRCNFTDLDNNCLLAQQSGDRKQQLHNQADQSREIQRATINRKPGCYL